MKLKNKMIVTCNKKKEVKYLIRIALYEGFDIKSIDSYLSVFEKGAKTSYRFDENKMAGWDILENYKNSIYYNDYTFVDFKDLLRN